MCRFSPRSLKTGHDPLTLLLHKCPTLNPPPPSCCTSACWATLPSVALRTIPLSFDRTSKVPLIMLNTPKCKWRSVAFVQTHSCDIGLVTETWLTGKTFISRILLTGYCFFLKRRATRHGGGFLAYVERGLFVSALSSCGRYFLLHSAPPHK